MNTSFIDRLAGTAEKRMRLMRVIYIAGTAMMVVGFILIILALIYPGLFP